MKCPNCGTPEKARVRVCGNCGTTYASEDLLEYRQLEFLLIETSSWIESAARRAPYVKRFEGLKARILAAPVAPPQAKPQPAAVAPMPPAPIQQPKPVAAAQAPAQPAVPPAQRVPPAPPKPKSESIPFDQWLLSERNIKFALYSGGLLFVLAGLIFIGLNWDKLNGPLKLGVTLLVTAFLYGGGLFLMSRQFLKIGGVAILTLASSFVPINFAVLQIYITHGMGLSNEMMWLIASVFAIAVYAVTTILMRTQPLVFLSLLALASGVGAALYIFHAPFGNYLLAYSILALGILIAAQAAKASVFASFTRVPLLIVSQTAAPILFVISASTWMLTRVGSAVNASPWVALVAMFVGAVFYAATDWILGWRFARAIVGAAFAASFLFTLFELQITPNWIGFALAFLAFVYLLVAYALEKRSSRADAVLLLVEAQLAAVVLFGVNALLWFLKADPASPWVAIGAMFIGVIFYAVTDWLYRARAARWAFGAGLWLNFLITLSQLQLPANLIGLAMSGLMCVYLAAAYLVEKKAARAEAVPFLVEAHLAAPILFVANATLWIRSTGCTNCRDGSSWLALGGLFLVVAFYAVSDAVYRNQAARWAAAFLFAIATIFTLTELRLTEIQTGLVLKVLALAYLGVGLFLKRRDKSRNAGVPLYAVGYLVAAFVTFQSLLKLPNGQFDLALALLGDTLILGISALVHRDYTWIYGAAWLLMAPVYIFLHLNMPDLVEQGMGLSALMIAYVALGYGLGQRAKRYSGPFLSAAAFLSVIVVAMTWANGMIATAVLFVIALAYAFVAVWLRRNWLILASLGAVNLSVVTFTHIYFGLDVSWVRVLTFAYGALGITLAFGGFALRRTGYSPWALPLYLVAVLNLAGAYVVSLELGKEYAVGASVTFASLALVFAWLERAVFESALQKQPPVLSYIGASLILIGVVFALDWAKLTEAWPPFIAGTSALLMLVEWLIRREALAKIYAEPVRRVGLIALVMALVGAALAPNYLQDALAFGIGGIALLAHARFRKNIYWGYAGAGAFVPVIWFLLRIWDVTQLQAYVLPLAFWLLAIGWIEKRRGQLKNYSIFTTAGLIVLLGSSFVQSFSGIGYSVLMLGESLAALGWGIRTRTRGYVQIAILSLLANGFVQFAFGFAALDRWLQLSIIGLILLVVGLVALFRREQILTARDSLMQEWKKWEA